MNSKWVAYFFYAASVVLTLTAAAKIYTAVGNARILSISDPVTYLSYRHLMWSVAALEAIVAACLISNRYAVWVRALALFWLSSNFILYRFAAEFLNVKLCPCLGTLASELAIRQELADHVLTGCVLFWFLGSLWILSHFRVENSPKMFAH